MLRELVLDPSFKPGKKDARQAAGKQVPVYFPITATKCVLEDSWQIGVVSQLYVSEFFVNMLVYV